MTSIAINCGHCTKLLPNNLRVVNCETYKNFYYFKYCGVTHKEFNSLKNANGCAKNVKQVIPKSTLH